MRAHTWDYFIQHPRTILWDGTAKAAEGYMCVECYTELRDEGFVVVIVWKDRDATGDIEHLFPGYGRRLCFGHCNRAFGYRLIKIAGRKEPDAKLRPELAGAVRRRALRGRCAFVLLPQFEKTFPCTRVSFLALHMRSAAAVQRCNTRTAVGV